MTDFRTEPNTRVEAIALDIHATHPSGNGTSPKSVPHQSVRVCVCVCCRRPADFQINDPLPTESPTSQ